MKHSTVVRWGPAIGAVVIGAGGIVAGLFAPSGGPNTIPIIIYTVIVAGILVIAAHAREWTQFAWLPLGGYLVVTVGNILGQEQVTTAGAFMTMLLVVVHGVMEQRRERRSQVSHG